MLISCCCCCCCAVVAVTVVAVAVVVVVVVCRLAAEALVVPVLFVVDGAHSASAFCCLQFCKLEV